ncbi:hypothetical protein F2Q68_00025498 [Brassica cretica]|uniref:Uncharacterized protein n=1 Tax=Brassica cretica TaxID=69181 RepID=A0A8S9IHP4_BRACR|nr:hypothetical protein F2Q68_00025498 [Brassica cretica]
MCSLNNPVVAMQPGYREANAVLFDRWLVVVPEKEGLWQQEVLWSLLKSWQWAFQQRLVVVVLAVVAELADVVVLELSDVVAMNQMVLVVLEAWYLQEEQQRQQEK